LKKKQKFLISVFPVDGPIFHWNKKELSAKCGIETTAESLFLDYIVP
jgi:hypothetical protein